MEWKFGKSYKLLYFQVRESPAPLNIPTPTPAPDRGGPDRHLEPFRGLGASFLIPGSNFGTSGAPWGAILAPRHHPGGPWE